MKVHSSIGFAATACLLAAPMAASLSLPTSLVSRTFGGHRKRDTIPAAIGIAPSQYWEGNDGPWSSFAVQVGVGSHIQTVRTMIGTSINNLITIAAGSEGCPSFFGSDCADSRGGLFNTNNSLSWVSNSIYEIGAENSLGMDFAATAGFDTVTLGWQGSASPSVEHTVIFNIAPQTFWLGVFGIGPYPTNFTSYQDPQPSFLETLASNNSIPSLSYGYTAGNQYRLHALEVYGSLTLGGYDQNRFVPSNVSFPMYADISKDLTVTLQSITTDAGNASDHLLPDGQIDIFIDSTVAQIYLPLSACEAFEKSFGLVYQSEVGLYTITATQRTALQELNPNVTFTIGGTAGGETVDITLPYGAFDLTAEFPLVTNQTYYFPLQRAANSTQYVLGRTFLQEAYLIADYDRRNFTVAPCVWARANVNTPDIVSILREGVSSGGSSSTSGISAGAIAGIVIGIVALIALLGLILFFLRRRKNAEKQRLASLEAKNDATKSSYSDSEHPFIGGGSELASTEIHELTSNQRTHAQELEGPHKIDPNKAGYSEMEADKAGYPAEMEGADAVYEMPGSDVHELPAPQPGRDIKY